MLLLLLLGVFVATVSLCIGIYLFVNRRQLAAAQTARARLSAVLEDFQRPPSSILRDTSASELAVLDRLLSGRNLTEMLARRLQRAGLATKPGTYLLAMGICAAAGALLGSFANSLVATLGLLVLGAATPMLWLRWVHRRRFARFQEQLPDAIDMLVGAMRAGYSFHAAMKFIGEEMPAPLGPEFMQFYDEHRLGVEVRTALLSMVDRMESTDLKMFVTAVLVQRETGGNLGEVLGNIADVMRQRADVERQIETLTAESKLSARLLAALPVIVFLAVLVLDPGFMRPMLVQPIGRAMLWYTAVSVVIGYWLLMRFASVDV